MEKNSNKKRRLVIIGAVPVVLIAAFLIFTFWPAGPAEMPTRALTTAEQQIVDASFDTNSLTVTAEEVYLAMRGGRDITVVGVINPLEELVPFSTSSSAIPGAYLVWRPDYSGGGSDAAISPNVTGMRRSVAEMEALLSRANVTSASDIVVYSADLMHDSARFVWQLRMLGHQNIWYMDGGMNAWLAAEYPTGGSSRLADVETRSNFVAPNYNPAAFNATLEMVIHALENPDEWIVIDTRAQAEFDGEQVGASSGAFGTGRIANSVFIPWNAVIDPDTQLLRSEAEIADLFLDAIGGRNVITYCQSGVRSAHTWLALTEVLGLENVWNYEGSWIEWSYAASVYSDFDGARVLELTEEWTDNEGAI
ncbi:MAG: hypothetical protein LBE55_00025 [Clostridiales bacterium]|jgi:thiosulfate/3-mercaptopyruvate sulfurtransferase|nr:hypothetical protein [Clostridiales bacterium]